MPIDQKKQDPPPQAWLPLGLDLSSVLGAEDSRAILPEALAPLQICSCYALLERIHRHVDVVFMHPAHYAEIWRRARGVLDFTEWNSRRGHGGKLAGAAISVGPEIPKGWIYLTSLPTSIYPARTFKIRVIQGGGEAASSGPAPASNPPGPDLSVE